MNIKEAREQLISLKENAKANYKDDEIFKKDYEALKIAIKIIDKKTETKKRFQKIIELFIIFSVIGFYSYLIIDIVNKYL